MSEIKWLSTDPNCNQYGRKIGERKYEFKQDWNYGGKIVLEQDEIDLNDYTDEQINDHLSPYGWSIDQLKDENSLEDAEWLMAECIFEQTAGGF